MDEGRRLPGYFTTSAAGVLAGPARLLEGVRFQAFGNLLTFEPAQFLYGYVDPQTGEEVPGERSSYERYADRGGRLPVVLVPTRRGLPRDALGGLLPPELAAAAVENTAEQWLAAAVQEGDADWTWLAELDQSPQPVRLLFQPLDGV